MNPGVAVARRVGLLRIVGVIVLCLWLFWHYFVAPMLGTIDKFTPWDGVIPGAYTCAPPAPAAPEVAGFQAMFHDAGAALRKISSGPPSATTIKAWFHSAGEGGALAVHYARGGLNGDVKPLAVAPAAPAPAPRSVAAEGSLGDAQVAALATQAGWPAAEVPNVVARVRAESQGNPRARDYADGSHWGLLQLGTAERQRYIPGRDAFDPLWNLRGARALWAERGWSPWKASDSAVAAQAVAAPLPCDAPGNMSVGSGSAVVQQARRFIGTPYVWGGEEPGGFDCSGLTQYVYKQLGVELPRTAEEQRRWAQPVQPGQLAVGDLVFFQSSPGADAHHVGLYIGDGQMIDAPHRGTTVQQRAVYGGEIITYGRVPGASRGA